MEAMPAPEFDDVAPEFDDVAPAIGVASADDAVREVSVLVVDDEPQVVWVLQFSLEAEGYRTFAANNGLEALAEIAKHRPDLMVLDIMMPAMDGWAVLGEVRKMPPEERPRVVIVSALASLRDRARAAELGADAYVPKPFNVDELLEVLHRLEGAGGSVAEQRS
jgi:CheY-like chemotaxis protein